MEFNRREKVTLTAFVRPLGWSVDFKVHVEVVDRGSATMTLVDYDDSVGAVAHFVNEAEAIANADAFVEAAMPAYAAKYAKYGQLPTFRLVGGGLVRVHPRMREAETGTSSAWSRKVGSSPHARGGVAADGRD